MKHSLKKAWHFLHSMQFAIALLLLICGACLIGSLLAQNNVESYYYNLLGENFAPLALALSLDTVFTALGMKRTRVYDADGVTVEYACKGRIGVWGAWVTHVGMLLVIVAFAIGQMFTFQTAVYGVPGVTKPIEGTPYQLTIDDFQIGLREDFTVEQYVADLTVTAENGDAVQGKAMVNHPMDAFGMRIYQNSTGWASDLSIYYEDELLSKDVIYAGEHAGLTNIPLTLVFHAFYPDYVNTPSGPSTRTPLLNNPVALFSIYYDQQLVDMNVVGMGYAIEVADYRFVFENPRQYTLLQVSKDPSNLFVFVGGVVLLLGLFLAFYVRAEEVWAVRENGETTLYARSEKGKLLFAEQFTSAIETLKEASHA